MLSSCGSCGSTDSSLIYEPFVESRSTNTTRPSGSRRSCEREWGVVQTHGQGVRRESHREVAGASDAHLCVRRRHFGVFRETQSVRRAELTASGATDEARPTRDLSTRAYHVMHYTECRAHAVRRTASKWSANAWPLYGPATHLMLTSNAFERGVAALTYQRTRRSVSSDPLLLRSEYTHVQTHRPDRSAGSPSLLLCCSGSPASSAQTRCEGRHSALSFAPIDAKVASEQISNARSRTRMTVSEMTSIPKCLSDGRTSAARSQSCRKNVSTSIESSSSITCVAGALLLLVALAIVTLALSSVCARAAHKTDTTGDGVPR